jgi:hypothetical protein
MYKLSLASPSFLHKYNESRRIDFFLGFTERRKREITKAPLCIYRERVRAGLQRYTGQPLYLPIEKYFPPASSYEAKEIMGAYIWQR